MRLRVRATGELIEASMRHANMGVDDGDCWAWVLQVPSGRGYDFPVKPPANGYELLEATDEERVQLRAGNYFTRPE